MRYRDSAASLLRIVFYSWWSAVAIWSAPAPALSGTGCEKSNRRSISTKLFIGRSPREISIADYAPYTQFNLSVIVSGRNLFGYVRKLLVSAGEGGQCVRLRGFKIAQSEIVAIWFGTGIKEIQLHCDTNRVRRSPAVILHPHSNPYPFLVFRMVHPSPWHQIDISSSDLSLGYFSLHSYLRLCTISNGLEILLCQSYLFPDIGCALRETISDPGLLIGTNYQCICLIPRPDHLSPLDKSEIDNPASQEDDCYVRPFWFLAQVIFFCTILSGSFLLFNGLYWINSAFKRGFSPCFVAIALIILSGWLITQIAPPLSRILHFDREAITQ